MMKKMAKFKDAENACGFCDTTDTAEYLGVPIERVSNLRKNPLWFLSTEAKELGQLMRDGG